VGGRNRLHGIAEAVFAGCESSPDRCAEGPAEDRGDPEGEDRVQLEAEVGEVTIARLVREQNLPPIYEGRLNPNLSDGPEPGE
jgi:hypothetical protein